MSQNRLYITASQNIAESYYEILMENFEEESYPIAINEVERDSSFFEVSLYRQISEIFEGEQEIFLKKIAHLLSIDISQIHIEELPDIDWVQHSLENLKPIQAAGFFIHGSHDQSKVPSNDIPIQIEANRAFGTGHHDTTLGCLILLEKIFKTLQPKNILDLGTGSGILAIACAKLLKKENLNGHILASDNDSIATEIANENFEINHVSDKATAILAEGFDHSLFIERKPFDLIIANILANPLMMLSLDIANHSKNQTNLILSGILETQRSSIIDLYQKHGFHLDEQIISNQWASLAFSKKE